MFRRSRVDPAWGRWGRGPIRRRGSGAPVRHCRPGSLRSPWRSPGCTPRSRRRRPSCSMPSCASPRQDTRSGVGSSPTCSVARSSEGSRSVFNCAGFSARSQPRRPGSNPRSTPPSARSAGRSRTPGGLRVAMRRPRLEEGLRAALTELADGLPVPLELDLPSARLPESVEAAALLHRLRGGHECGEARGREPDPVAPPGSVDGALHVTVTDDGRGGARVGGSGLTGLAERVRAHGGSLVLDSPFAALFTDAGHEVIAKLDAPKRSSPWSPNTSPTSYSSTCGCRRPTATKVWWQRWRSGPRAARTPGFWSSPGASRPPTLWS